MNIVQPGGKVLAWLDRLFTRRLHEVCDDAVPESGRRRLQIVCRQLTGAEEAAAELMGLCVRPRLLMVDEELATIITPSLRDEIVRSVGRVDADA
jgi:ABC-type branched-subunit amino acid transport system ATPase component